MRISKLISTAVILCSAGLLFSQCLKEEDGAQVVVSGHRNPNISIVDLGTKQIVWQRAMLQGEQCNSLRLLEDNSLLAFTTQLGAKVVDIASGELKYNFELDSLDTTSEVHSLCPRPDGGLSIFVAGTPARVIELDSDFSTIATLEFDGVKKSKHSQFRQAIIGQGGNYLIPIYGKKGYIELSREGEVVSEHVVGGSIFSLRELPSGNLIMGMGDRHSIIEYNPKEQAIVKEITQIEGIELLYMSQVEPIAPNRIMVANWSGHNKKEVTAPAPQLFELDEKGELIWQWSSDETDIDKVSAFAYSHSKIVK